MPAPPPDATETTSILPGAGGAEAPSGVLVEQAPLSGAGGTVLTPAAADRSRRTLGFTFWLSVSWIGLIVVLAVIAGLLPIPDPKAIEFQPGLNPSLHHLFGTDDLGRDLFSRVIYGARVSLTVGFFSILFGLVIGGILGLLAGFYRGVTDGIVVGLSNVILAFPAFVLLIAVVSFWGPSLLHITLTIGILSIGPLAVVVRGNTIRFAQREFVMAARMLGAKNSRIIFREILANVVPSGLALGLVSVPVAIVAEGGLSFLGLSVRLPTPTWGNMIAEGRVILTQHPGVAFWPALFLFLTVLALNLVGDRLTAYFDVREGAL
ncbi:MAG TPA: ABC transporter permease [Acidimicrobiales bacterium]|nr:ABC transporter permease [Acidimicrobiales bacterium]